MNKIKSVVCIGVVVIFIISAWFEKNSCLLNNTLTTHCHHHQWKVFEFSLSLALNDGLFAQYPLTLQVRLICEQFLHGAGLLEDFVNVLVS
jgi:hypothetical protein